MTYFKPRHVNDTMHCVLSSDVQEWCILFFNFRHQTLITFCLTGSSYRKFKNLLIVFSDEELNCRCQGTSYYEYHVEECGDTGIALCEIAFEMEMGSLIL